jgi:MFS family permease
VTADPSASAAPALPTVAGAPTASRFASRAALAACLLAGFATLLDQTVVSFTVPSLSADFQAPTGAIQWFLAVYSLTFGVGLVPAGRLGDAHGRRGLFVTGLALFFVGALGAVFAPGIGWAIAGRAIQGFGAGVISAQVLGIIQDLYVGRSRIRALAAYGIAASASAIVGPLLAATVLAVVPGQGSWRAILTISLPFVALTGVLALRYAPRATTRPGRVGLDLPGILLTAVVVLLATIPVVDPGIQGSVRTLILSGVAISVVALVFWERRLAAKGGRPLFAPGLVRSGGFVSGNVTALLWFGAAGAQGAIITVFLLQSYRLPGFAVAVILIPGALARIAGSSFSARIFDRLAGWTQPACLAVEAVAAVTLAVLAGVTTGSSLLIALVTIQILLGFASGVFEPPMRATTLSFAGPGQFGLAASFLQLTQRLSSTFCIAWVTGIAFASGIADISADSLRAGLLICAALLAVAFAESLRRVVSVRVRGLVG